MSHHHRIRPEASQGCAYRLTVKWREGGHVLETDYTVLSYSQMLGVLEEATRLGFTVKTETLPVATDTSYIIDRLRAKAAELR